LYKLLLSDLDGTLRVFSGGISPAVKDATQRAMRAGCRFTLATGRVLQSALPFAEELQVNAPLICCSGGMIVEHRTREVWYQRTMPIPLVQEVLRFAMQEGLPFSTYLADLTTSLRSDGSDKVFFEWVGEQRMRAVSAPLTYLRTEPLNCLIHVADEHATTDVAQRLRARLGSDLRVTQTTPHLLECMPSDVSKAYAAELLATRLGITRAEVLALGDNENDVELLRWAGLGVAVGSATPAALAAADQIVASVDEDGAVEAIQRFIPSVAS